MALCVDKSAIQQVANLPGGAGYVLPPGTLFDCRTWDEQSAPSQTPTRGVLLETSSPGEYDFNLGDWNTPLNAARKTAIQQATGKAVESDANSVGMALLDFLYLHAATDGSTCYPLGFDLRGKLRIPFWASLKPHLANLPESRLEAYKAQARIKQRAILSANFYRLFAVNELAARKYLMAVMVRLRLDPRDPGHRGFVKRALLNSEHQDSASYDPEPYETREEDLFEDAAVHGNWGTLTGATPTETGGYQTPGSTAFYAARWNADLSTDDMLVGSEVDTLTHGNAGQIFIGALSRVSNAAWTGYRTLYGVATAGVGVTYDIYVGKVAAGTPTYWVAEQDAHTTTAPAAGTFIYNEVIDSEVRGYISTGAWDYRFLDTTITGNVRGGLEMRASNVANTVRIESWFAEDTVADAGGGETATGSRFNRGFN